MANHSSSNITSLYKLVYILFLFFAPSVNSGDGVYSFSPTGLLEEDIDGDGNFSASDLTHWLVWVFFWPGDSIINLLFHTPVGNVLNQGAHYLYGLLPLVFSIAFWLILFRYIKLFVREIILPISKPLQTPLLKILNVIKKTWFFIRKKIPIIDIFYRILIIVFNLMFLYFCGLAMDWTHRATPLVSINQKALPRGSSEVGYIDRDVVIHLMAGHGPVDSSELPQDISTAEEDIIYIEERQIRMATEMQTRDSSVKLNRREENIESSEDVTKFSQNQTIDQHMEKIVKKIQDRIAFPLPVDGKGVTYEVLVTRAGIILLVRKLSSSGNEAYDDAVERAILSSQPLPVPEGEKIYREYFRLLNMTFKKQ